MGSPTACRAVAAPARRQGLVEVRSKTAVVHRSSQLAKLLERLALNPTIDVQIAASNGDSLAGKPNDAFHREFTSLLGRVKRNGLPSSRPPKDESEFVDQHAIAAPQLLVPNFVLPATAIRADGQIKRRRMVQSAEERGAAVRALDLVMPAAK